MRINTVNGTVVVTEAEKEKNELPQNIQSIGQQLAMEKLKNIQKDSTINSLGFELSKLKIEVIQLKGGA